MVGFWSVAWKAGGKLGISNRHGLVRCETGWEFEVSYFEDFDFWVVLEGRGKIRIDDQEFEIQPGFISCFTPGKVNLYASHDSSRPLRVFYCHFDLIDRDARMKLPSITPKQLPPDSLMWHGLPALSRSLAENPKSALSQAGLWHALIEWENLTDVTQYEAEQLIRNLAAEIREQPGGDYTAAGLARRAGMSESHFRRKFRSIIGCAPMPYVVSQRMERACYYLRGSSLTIQEISEALGYSDIFYFSRHFKSHTGLSPSGWRKGQEA